MARVTTPSRTPIQVAVAAALAIVLGGLGVVVSVPAASATPTMEAEFLSRLNGYRATKCLGPLPIVTELSDLSRAYSGVMASTGQFQHAANIAEGLAPGSWLGVGENIAWGSNIDPSMVLALHNGLVASPGHEANMTNTSWDGVGIGVDTSVGELYVTFRFIDRPGIDPPAAAGCSAMRDATTIAELTEAADYNRPAHGEILRLYRAFFGREPDIGGAKYWILDVYEAGQGDIVGITGWFASPDQPEFVAAYADIPASDHAAYLTRVYDNMLGRTPDPAGFAYWLGLMNDGTLDRGGVVRFVALNDEFVSLYNY